MRPPARLIRALLVALAAVASIAMLPAGQVSTHTELDYTLPADGTTVGEPVTEISVAFTEEVSLIGSGFKVLDPTTGLVLEPFVVTDDDMVFRLQLDPALGGGQVGVRYEVSSADGHVVEGSFTFTVAVPAPTTPTTPAPTSPPTTIATTDPATDESSTTTVASTTVAASTTSVGDVTASDEASAVEEASDDGTSSGTIIAIAAAVAVGAVAFLFVRSRRGG